MYELFDQPPAWASLGGGSSELMEDDEFTPPRESPDSDEPAEQDYPNLEVTYSLFGEEPGFDSVYEQASDWLEMPGGFFETFSIFPVNISS